MKNTEVTKEEKKHLEFNKKVLSAVEHLHPYVKHRLFIAETSKIVPKNMYKTNGLIDDAIVKLYEEYGEKIIDSTELKLKLFKLVDKRLDELFKNEEWHLDTMSTSRILNKELKQLEEKFMLDAEEDLIMSDELDDISYHQKDTQKEIFLYDDAEQNIIKTLDIYDIRNELNTEKRKVLNRIYSWLPQEMSNMVDLYIFGKLNFQEIGIVRDIDASEVKATITFVKKSFRKNLS